MQTILGAGGVIGRELAKELPRYTDTIRLVSRTPVKVNAGDELVAADLTDAEQTAKAVEGSDVVYLTVGLPYNIKVWREQWPVVMSNVIAACKQHGARLVFFDNVYAYGRVKGPMTEDTPVRPASKKGEVRARIADMLMDEVQRGELTAQIVRSADFYGPGADLSFVTVLVFDNLRKGKKPQWMIRADVRHSLTYTPDAGRATAMLGNTGSAFNQVWHLPTSAPAPTGRQLMEMAAGAFGMPAKYTVLPRFALQLVGLFNSNVRESIEMLYQYDSDYVFDSNKFNTIFNFRPTSYEEGIAATVREMK